MSSRSDFDYNAINFDDFHTYPSKIRKEILNDPELVKIMVKKNMKPSRYKHSLSVAETAKKLAICHHVDPNRAYMAGLLHDVTKDLSDEIQDEYLTCYDPEKLDYPVKVKHSFSAKYYLKEKVNLHDSGILNAVYNHTICTSRDKLSMIVYIADKREPLRKLDDGLLEIAMKDLYEGFALLQDDVADYLKRKGSNE